VRVLGIDPGIATTGYGVVEGEAGGSAALLGYGAIRTAPPAAMPARLAELHRELQTVIAERRPDAVAVEELFFASNASTALVVGQARGVILLAAAQASLPVFEYKPTEVKQALTGYGGADKRQVQEMLRLVLGLDRVPQPDDAADGVAVALCHLQMARWREL
jgi:crossover junction endodeoxyribonuclease RuvC